MSGTSGEDAPSGASATSHATDEAAVGPFGGLDPDDGLELADRIAAGVKARCDEYIGRGRSGVVLSIIDVVWLVDAYDYLRKEADDA